MPSGYSVPSWQRVFFYPESSQICLAVILKTSRRIFDCCSKIVHVLVHRIINRHFSSVDSKIIARRSINKMTLVLIIIILYLTLILKIVRTYFSKYLFIWKLKSFFWQLLVTIHKSGEPSFAKGMVFGFFNNYVHRGFYHLNSVWITLK